MTADDAFQLLHSFFTIKSAPRQALSKLREGVEVGIVIGDMVECSVFRQGHEIRCERRLAVKPDFVFSIRPETVVVLAEHTPDEVGEIGVGLIKEILAGNVSVRMPGGFLSVITNGYLEMVALGGSPVAQILGRHGMSSAPKIIAFLKKMRR